MVSHSQLLTKSDIKGKKEVSKEALGECWATLSAHPHPPLLFREELLEGGGGEAGVMKRPPTNVFVLHNSAVNSFSLYNLTFTMAR